VTYLLYKKILDSLYFTGNNTLGGKKQIDPGKLRYRYEWINYDQAALLKNKYNVNTGAYPAGAVARVDTSWVESGVIRNKTILRPLRFRKDLISSKIVNVYPDTVMWLRDFQYAYNDPKMRMYFSHPGFANYPVVGVTWEQCQAFCQWRTNLFNNTHAVSAQDYRLPTEAEWEYAARGGRKMALYPWGGNYVRDERGCFLANFKPMRGSYTDDQGATTMKVASFEPNDFGLYDMAGNVAEWTSSAYDGSSSLLVSDMNPSFQYNAKNNDPDILKRKVVKGGSWKDIAYYLQCGVRTYEYQTESRPYIGFRCVRSYNGE
jgi:gliding motility-associated lipoprotein GldK